MSWGLRLWNGRDEQLITVLFPNPFVGDDGELLREPQWNRLALWDDVRRRYAGGGDSSAITRRTRSA